MYSANELEKVSCCRVPCLSTADILYCTALKSATCACTKSSAIKTRNVLDDVDFMNAVEKCHLLDVCIDIFEIRRVFSVTTHALCCPDFECSVILIIDVIKG